ncbi:putative 3'-5' exonuclease related to the exonuclease domain of PolB [mine drainage metagenome]|uniref:Putative 3'-5' exonuclease related to the exonuclease domain of PolB n=1 Tax=mine drainage metagenome TaxID=410659 RepID=A0A1J5QUH2_9ZZZZ
MIPALVFDIETVPDTEGLKKLLALPAETPAADVASIAFHQRRQLGQSEFLPLHLQRVVAISCVLREGEHFRVWSLGTPDDDEGVLVQRFFDGIEKYTPNLISWNGGGFDLPVLHYRAMIHNVVAARYWDMGEDDRDFKWNNYISRYHMRHTDLMDVLALYQGRGNAPLDQLAQLCGFPGKLGMDGSRVWEAYQAGEIEAIRNYCETDVVNTWLVYLRFQQMRGLLTTDAYQREIALVRATLEGTAGAHWQEFLQHWN